MLHVLIWSSGFVFLNIYHCITCYILSECTSSQADVVFLVDDSSSVGISNFKNKVRPFVQDVVRTLDIGPSAVQVGYTSFSNTVVHQFNLNEYMDKDALISAIGDVLFRTGGTDIQKALTEAYKEHFQTAANGVRKDSAKVLVLITDGSSTGTNSISQTIRDAGITILCVGIKSANLAQLESIAGDPSKVFIASDFSRLASIQENLITETCEGRWHFMRENNGNPTACNIASHWHSKVQNKQTNKQTKKC